jgi:hypothetical protein
LDLQIKRYDFCKIGLNSDSDFYLKICLNTGRPRGCFLLEDTGSGGSPSWSVRSKEDWTREINRYSPLKWIYQIHWILFGRPGLNWRGAHRSNLGFRPSSPARRAEGGQRRRYSDSWTTATSRQDAGGRGGLGSLVDVLDCVRTKEREAAGDARGDDVLRDRDAALDLLQNKTN